MKRLFLLLFVVALSLPTLAQQSSGLFEQLTDKHADKEGFSASQISSEMFDLYLKKRNIEEESPVFDALKKLDNILVVSQSNLNGFFNTSGSYTISSNSNVKTKKEDKEDKNVNEAKEVHLQILDYYKKNNYSLLKTEKRMGEDVKVYLKKNQDKIESLALVTSSSVSTNLVELQGDIDLKTVSDLNQALNLRGLENLYKIDNSNNTRYRVVSGGKWSRFPDEKSIEEMVTRQREMIERQHNLTDEQRDRIEEQSKEMAEKQMQMAEKYREMAEKYRREPIFLSYPGDTNTVYTLNGKKVKAKEIKELDKSSIKRIEVETAEKEDEKTKINIKTK